MKKIPIPNDERGWRDTASAIVRANLKLARMNHIDLSKALERIGVDEPPKNISSKLVRGSFSTVFFLQSLHVMGVETLDLPTSTEPLN